MQKILLLGLLFLLVAKLEARQGTSPGLKGKVLNATDLTPIPGVNVVIKGTSLGGITGEDGSFTLSIGPGEFTLNISFIGFKSQELDVSLPSENSMTILLEEDALSLAEFQVISTGFQELPAERATGSFVQVDEELVSRRVSTSILDRLEDITPGLIFNRDRADLGPGESISIRGNSTLLANRNPLIVVDNLAYDGPIENLNPNDVESITVLRDAAAASIWGARAGNGVIVIKTKSGKYDSPLRLNFNSNLTWGESFDPFYAPQMNISEFVDVEQRLFNQGIFDGLEQGFGNPKLSLVVEDLIALRDGKITQSELDARLSGYKGRDSRSDLSKYFYRTSLNQQYSLQLSGGSLAYSYLVGLGYDNNRETQQATGNDRITLNAQQNWKLNNGKLKFGLGTYLIQSDRTSSFPDVSGIEPYDQLVGESGQPLPIFWKYSSRFKESFINDGILDWEYYPYSELGLSPRTFRQTELRINPRLEWEIAKGLSLISNYQFWQSNSEENQLYGLESYYARDLINQFTEIGTGGLNTNGIPIGSIYDFSGNRAFSHNWRTQLNLNKSFGNDHQLNALAGFEVKDFQSNGSLGRAYGYDEETGLSQPIDNLTYYPDLTTGFTNQIPFRQSFSGSINRYISYFTNADYTYKGKYTITGSARMDGSNLYGVSTNNQIVPLWSAGMGWILSEESWMNRDWIDYLKLKASYGFNGNTNPAATAFTTATLFGAPSNRWVGQPWLSVISPPNPELRWEKIKIINLGAEFELFGSRLNGGVEVYRKEGLDLFGSQPNYPSSGQSTITRNYANTLTNGLDLNLSGMIVTGDFNWTAHFFYSWISEKVTGYAVEPVPASVSAYSSGLSGISPSPVEGYPLYSMFSFPFAGLNPDNGNPQGILDGEASSNYSGILASTEMEDLIYHGSSIPTHFGALRNQVNWRGFEFSFNISYRMGYYFRRESIVYDNLNRGEIGHSDYALRWQKPGDELITSVPSDPLKADPQRNSFDMLSSRSVRKGDHIRFQDIQFSYTLNQEWMKNSPFSQVQVYSYINNLGILWKAAKDVRDPDFRNIQAPRTYSLGLKMNF